MRIILLSIITLALVCCGGGISQSDATEPRQEDKGAKERLQGVWIEEDTEQPAMKVSGDTIYYADSISAPAYFKIVADSVFINGESYHITKHTGHIFHFEIEGGNEIRLNKTDDPIAAMAFVRTTTQTVSIYDKVEKTDTVVSYNGTRYHCYIAINPTRYRVTSTTHDENGLQVDKFYYDNIIHLSVYEGKRQIFSSDIKKQDFTSTVPAKFLDQAILSDAKFNHVDSDGFHFDTSLCIPDMASCYMIDTSISFDGKKSVTVTEY